MDGIIIINKEKGYTSNDIVQIVKKIFNEKVGHTGTLDPMATGVLPLLIGKATLCSKYLINHDKIYIATLKLGIKTDTGDATGNILESEKIKHEIIEESKVKDALEKLKGKQFQVPPMYSAIKVNGKKLYEYARKGQKVEVKPREINVYDTKLVNIDKSNNEIQFEISCSKGTYIRTICEDLAKLLGTIGTMYGLNRVQVGDFNIKDSITIQELKKNYIDENSISFKNFVNKHIISVESFFKDAEKITLTPRAYISFINGAKLFSDEPNGVYRIYDINNKFIGTGTIKSGILKRDIVFFN